MLQQFDLIYNKAKKTKDTTDDKSVNAFFLLGEKYIHAACVIANHIYPEPTWENVIELLEGKLPVANSALAIAISITQGNFLPPAYKEALGALHDHLLTDAETVLNILRIIPLDISYSNLPPSVVKAIVQECVVSLRYSLAVPAYA